MDFKGVGVNLLVSTVMVIKRFVGLIFSPYKTMWTISKEKDHYQSIIIFSLVYLYFQFSQVLRRGGVSPFFIFLIFLLFFFFTIGFFFYFSKVLGKKGEMRQFFMTFTYTLLPTLIWFFSTLLLYYLFPPPRGYSILGKAFSVFFISFSVSLLVWKVILFYLAIRFSSRLSFAPILYMMILYSFLLIFYTVVMYQLDIFRVPFI